MLNFIQMTQKISDRPALGASIAAAALGMALTAPSVAQGQEFRLNVEPAAAFWLDKPQSERFTPGFYGAIRPGVAIGPIVTIQGSYALLATPAKGDYEEFGVAHLVEAGLRVRPFGAMVDETQQLGGLFVDFNFGYVRTGPLDRFGLDAGLGYNFQVAPSFALGPVVRYTQIFQDDKKVDQDANDAQVLTVGLNFAFGPAHKVEPESDGTTVQGPLSPYPVPAPAPAPVTPACLDTDKDGICDFEDRCPEAGGPAATLGCPIDPCLGPKLVVLVQFPYDSAALPPPVDGDLQTMDPVLDAMAKAMAKTPACRVCIVGYASEEGGVDHNLDLSRQRGKAVQGYLTARGLSAKRMPTTGLGASCQLVPEMSRMMNRRVEFHRLDEGQGCPVDCSK
jgi:hypothetical protein